jgi:hypothetical protein
MESQSKVRVFFKASTPQFQYAAARAMYQLTGEERYGDRLMWR